MSVTITVATTGPIASKADNPWLPTQPDEIADQVGRNCRAVQARLAGYAFEVGHQGRFRSVAEAVYMTDKSRNDILLLWA